MATRAVETGLQQFLDYMLPRQRAAEQAIHNGDAGPRTALWSRVDPVTVFGADMSAMGWDDVGSLFEDVASWFSDSEEYEFEVIAAGASGDLAYTVGYEHNRVQVEGVERTYTLRVTHVYRREDGQWRIVHRHGDRPPAGDKSFAAAQGS
jgi:ketosteroid isomerase-like protein